MLPNATILDIGAGRAPAVPKAARPPGVTYVGFDIDRDELAAAPADAYDETIVGDACTRMDALEDRFDLVLTYQVLEHVKPLESALENTRAYLRPGGRMISLVAGTFAAFAIANRVLPERVGVRLMQLLLHREPETVFRAYYDGCWHGGLERRLASWSRVEIEPFYLGAQYFSFSPLLQRLYVRYEDWALRGAHRNLATHYLVDATP